jgi:hypothetical protein
MIYELKPKLGGRSLFRKLAITLASVFVRAGELVEEKDLFLTC